jgi:hypothetical protein
MLVIRSFSHLRAGVKNGPHLRPPVNEKLSLIYGSLTGSHSVMGLSFTGHLLFAYGKTHVIYHLPPLYRG